AHDVTAWENFSGRLEAVYRVQVRSRVAGAILSVAFCEGAEAAVAVVLIGNSKNNAEPDTDATRPMPAPTRAKRFFLDVIGTLLT
ncbi:hypothetical protein ACC702_38980, partial [Rhizobium ruizarguesonis]